MKTRALPRRLALLLAAATLGAGAARAEPPAGGRPDIVVIMLDDLGYSDFGCYGGEIRTPNVDRIAAEGVRFSRFYNASRCCPTRAAMLTGLYPHQVGLARNGRDLSRDGATIAELLRAGGYQTAMAGKWHLSETRPAGGKDDGPEHLAWLNHQADFDRPFADPATYPINRGFDRHYGSIWGVIDHFDPFSLVDGVTPVRDVPDDFYMTDAITAKSVESIRAMAAQNRPFFLYVAHNAPHWPLHARPEDIARYRGRYDKGWHALREERYRRQVALGLVDPAKAPLPPLMGNGPDWDQLDDAGRAHESALMAVHAAMVDRVDQGIGQIVDALRETGRLDNTLLMVLADNGASPERYMRVGFDRSSQTREGRPIRYAGRFEPGSETTWGYIGSYWANAANTPFRFWKVEAFDGGCRTPMIVRWPAGVSAAPGSTTGQLGHVVDLMPTCLDVSGVSYPPEYAGHPIRPLEGKSLSATFRGGKLDGDRALYFEHEGGRAVIDGDWKLVAQRGKGRAWELYHVSEDATETRNLAAQHPDRVAAMTQAWLDWARRVGAEIPAGADLQKRRNPTASPSS
ncbi:arylsulfatase [Tundrisphaera sp. TA3]|uniref:arylsulfatase n=1 Tax=Tundrisphaera sp. TA3 TaxID=3435775 RepID=UPI003EBA5F1D